MNAKSAHAELQTVLESIGTGAVAVSGGVDSMTLAVVAHRTLGLSVEMYHATSAAVPPEATARVEHYALREGWTLNLINAGEFTNQQYIDNPINRCYYCKTHLYDAIANAADGVLMSGTNTDDLGDFRPGLTAAAEHNVRHPFVDANISKDTIRAIARQLELDDLSELPAAPCLSSRVETGIPIAAPTLGAIHWTERFVGRELEPDTVRCRVRASGIVIELDPATLNGLSSERLEMLRHAIAQRFPTAAGVTFAPYRMGSAFVAAPSL